MKLLPRLLLVAGILAIGFKFVRVVPRDVTLVYAVGAAGPRDLEVEIDHGGEAVRRAELHLRPGESQVAHRVRLTDGEYRLHIALRDEAGKAPRTVDRPLTVSEDGTVVLPLKD